MEDVKKKKKQRQEMLEHFASFSPPLILQIDAASGCFYQIAGLGEV